MLLADLSWVDTLLTTHGLERVAPWKIQFEPSRERWHVHGKLQCRTREGELTSVLAIRWTDGTNLGRAAIIRPVPPESGGIGAAQAPLERSFWQWLLGYPSVSWTHRFLPATVPTSP
jgi:hypothetical protein